MLPVCKSLLASILMVLTFAPPTIAGQRYAIGRAPTADEIRGWDIDVRPDGQGLPEGKGTAAAGETLFMDACSGCHGEFGEGNGRWPALAGGRGTLAADSPMKTIGSYWPYASTVFDYVRHAMPYGNAQSLSVDDYYALTAYLLYLNDIVADQNFELSPRNLAGIRMPNEAGFYLDDRPVAEQTFWRRDPCMTDCSAAVVVTGRAQAIDVTPDDGKQAKAPGME